MADQHLQWITLESCITDYMDRSEQSNHKYFKLFHIAYGGFEKLGIDAFYTIQSFKLPVNANLTVTIPATIQKITKVGVFNQQGEVIPISQNSNLSAAFDLSPNRISQTTDNTLQTEISQQGGIWYNYWNGYGYGVVYGLPSGSPFIGSYKIDNANGVIVLSESFSYPYVLVEAICTPTMGETYYLPVQFREAMIAWIAWQDIAYIPAKTHVQNSSVGQRRHDYFEARRLAIASYDPVMLMDLYHQNLINQRLTVKA